MTDLRIQYGEPRKRRQPVRSTKRGDCALQRRKEQQRLVIAATEKLNNHNRKCVLAQREPLRRTVRPVSYGYGLPHGVYGLQRRPSAHITANGMARPDDGDEDFSGDDLDALPSATIEALEQTAIQLTQRNPALFDSQALQQQLQQTYQTLPTLPSTRAQTGGYIRRSTGRQHAAKHTELPSSDYGNFDEEAFHAELLDALDPLATVQENRETVESKVLGEATCREQSYKSRYSNASGAESSRFTGDQGRRGREDVNYGGGGDGDMEDKDEDVMEVDTEAEPLDKYTTTIDALQAQIQEVRRVQIDRCFVFSVWLY
jgi:hypothetical protein